MNSPNLIAQVQSQPESSAPTSSRPGLSTDFFASVGLMGTVLILLVTAFAKSFPNYLDRFLASKEIERNRRLEAEEREQTADLQREQALYNLLADTLKTLHDNQLETSRQFRDEFVSQMAIQGQQMAVILNDMGKSLQNQERFFQVAAYLQRELAEIRLEIERSRKGSEPSQSVPAPKLPVLPLKQ